MGKAVIEKDKKRFKSPSDYHREFLFFLIFIAIGVFVSINIFSWSEAEINNFINDNSGNSEDKLGKAILRVFVYIGGRTGFIIGMSVFEAIILYTFYQEVAEYLRLKKKLKLYQNGVIKNIYDIYDDYEGLSLWRRIKNLFTKKKNPYKSKHFSRREMKKRLKEQEKLGRMR